MRRRNEQGVAAVEFALAGVGTIFLLICTFHVSMGMWNYHTMAYAAHEATRYLSVKGTNCHKPGNTCAVTVGNIAQKVKKLAIGVPAGSMSMKLTTDSGAVTTCAPVSSCYTNTTGWPPTSNGDSALGKKISISLKYRFQSPLLFFWPGAGTQRFGEIWLPADSTQTILF